MLARQILAIASAAVGLFGFPGLARADDPTTAECLAASDASIALSAEDKLGDARAQLSICASATCPEDVRTACAKRLEVVDPSVAIGPAARPAAPFPAPLTMPPRAAGPEAASGSRGGTQANVGLLVGAAGLVGVAVGAFMGLRASTAWTRATSECNALSCRDHGGAVDDQSSASTAATISTISFVAGALALAGGVLLFLTAPHSPGAGKPAAETPSVRWATDAIRGASGGL